MSVCLLVCLYVCLPVCHKPTLRLLKTLLVQNSIDLLTHADVASTVRGLNFGLVIYYIHTMCMRTAKAFGSLRICYSPICTEISRTSQFNYIVHLTLDKSTPDNSKYLLTFYKTSADGIWYLHVSQMHNLNHSLAMHSSPSSGAACLNMSLHLQHFCVYASNEGSGRTTPRMP